MGNEVTEQKEAVAEESSTKIAEVSALQSIRDGLSKTGKETVSEQKPADEAKAKEGEKPSTETTPEPKLFKVFKSEDEFNLELEKAITPRVQSAKDKELAPLQTKVSDLTKENTKLKKDLTRKREDFQTEELEEEEAATWGERKEVKDFQTARREQLKRERAITDGEADLEDRAGRVASIEEAQESRDMAIKFLLGDKGDEFGKNLESLVKELSACKTPKEKELTLKVKASQISQPAEAPKAEAESKVLKKVDSSKATSPSGSNLDGMSPRDLIKFGLSKK
jgi:hypothetical protein